MKRTTRGKNLSTQMTSHCVTAQCLLTVENQKGYTLYNYICTSGFQRHDSRNSLGSVDELLSTVGLRRIRVLSAEVLRDLPRRKLRLADVSEIPRQMDRFTCETKKGYCFFIRPQTATLVASLQCVVMTLISVQKIILILTL